SIPSVSRNTSIPSVSRNTATPSVSRHTSTLLERMKSFTLIAVVVSLTTASVEHREKLITGVVRQGGDSLQKTWTNTPGVYGHTLGGTGTVYPTGYYPYITPYIPVSNEVTEAFTARRASPFTTAGSKIVFAEGVTQVCGITYL
ncbi:hypothetical protein OTU49_004115, partial [Cherax quadricarinatus]